jgi:hypothetical protein
MDLTRENLIEKIKKNDTNFFYELYNDSYNNTDYNIVYDQHYGDGNDYFITLHFPKVNLYVLLDGTYSSWDSPYWDSVSQAQPYEFTETRYKPVTLQYLRDQKIEEVLK